MYSCDIWQIITKNLKTQKLNYIVLQCVMHGGCLQIHILFWCTLLGMNMSMSSKEWLAEGVGVVKSEEYDDKGKLFSKSVLTKFED